MNENQPAPEDGLSEQQIIENYLQEYRLEDVMDEVINQVVINRPANPYLEIAAGFESKTLPEIIDIQFTSTSFFGSYAVKASIVTNLGTFTGTAQYSCDVSNFDLEPKDYTVLDGKFKELLGPINPQNFKQVEGAIQSIQDIDKAESFALSIAALRASAKFKGVKPYELLAEIANTKDDALCIPLPVPIIATMTVPNTKAIKAIRLFPVRTSSFESTIVKLNQIFNRLHLHEKAVKPSRLSLYGSTCVDLPTVEDLMKLINTVIDDAGEESTLKIGINHQGEQCLKPNDPPPPAPQYFASNAAVKTGQELVEQLLITWTEVDCVSIEDIVIPGDIQSVRHLKKRIQEVLFEVRNAGGEKLRYCNKGIGNDATCNLQVPMDGTLLLNVAVEDLEKQLLELPYNAVKIHLPSFATISQAIEVCDRARQLNLPIIIDTCSQFHQNLYASTDTIEADFAVGVGAVQFFGNGLYDVCYNLKLDRLQQIVHEANTIPFVGGKFRTGPEF